MIRLVLLLCLLAAPTAQAQFSGTVRGTVRTVDTRVDPYAAAGYGFADALPSLNPNRQYFRQPGRFANKTITVPEALVEVCVILVATPGCKPLWTRTNNAGQYSVTWSGLTSAIAIYSKVYPIRPLLSEGAVLNQDEIPAQEFRITTAGFENVNVGEASRFSATASLGGTQIMDIMVSELGQEVMDAYLTARETYTMLDTQSQPSVGGTIRSDMKGLDIFANWIGDFGDSGGGLAFFDDDIYLAPGTGQARPFTVAHEIGHIVAWRAMDWSNAPYEFSSYSFGADVTLSWSDLSNEYERPAFWEGFAHSVASMWMWRTAATPVAFTGNCASNSSNRPGIPRSGGCRKLEVASDGCPRGSTVGHRRALCVARAFWDILDDPSGDEDQMSQRDLGSIVNVFRQYPRICVPFFDNGCRDEGGYDDNNWKDYRRNHESRYPNDANALNVIEIINDMTGGNNG